jgi:trk system potassium uptake protein
MKFQTKRLHQTVLWASLVGFCVFFFDFGFDQSELVQQLLDAFYFLVIGLGLVSTFIRYYKDRSLFNRRVFAFDLMTVLYSLYVFYLYIFVGKAFQTDFLLENPVWVALAVILTFFREFFEIRIALSRTYFNPAQIFILSFLAIILLGALLLMLPKASNNNLSFIDALFTSTSAVCVTGLIVVDTATYFTTFGKFIIITLIQIGGLGILTFASYFSYFFKGSSTLENQFTLSEMVNSNKIGEVFSTLKHIILITLTVEGISAILIFLSLRHTEFNTFFERVFFAAFHAISAFCNAGFSTLTNNIYEAGFRFNYELQLVITFTLIMGGLGFPIVVNILEYVKHKFKQLFFNDGKKNTFRPWVLNINSRITLITTVSVTLVAFILFFILEYKHTLADHPSLSGKMVTAFFGAASPRTAGFNVVDMAAQTLPTVVLTILLMFIGASPASTGGGIKTSTFAIAILNMLSLAKGKSRIEVYRREISDLSVKRAFATITLSLLAIGIGIFIISIYDADKGLLNIVFECFSAFNTVGLSLGVTASLSSASKFVLIVLMFVGRVSMLSILIAVIKKVYHKNYRYPTEEITIN